MHGFPVWFDLLLHPLTWALLVAMVLAIAVFGWRRVLFYAVLIFPGSFICMWDTTSRAQWLKWWRNGGL